MEYLKLIPGFRTALADGVMVPHSPCHMATWEFYRAAPGSRIHLCRDGYVFAPAIFSMEREPVYLYTYAYQPEENWTTYTRNLTPESYGKEDYIFDKDCWFRLCVKRTDGEELTEEDQSRAEELAAFFHDEIPYQEKPWFDREIEAVARRVREADNDHTLKFCLLTDTHYTVNGIWEDTASNIQRMARKVGYDAVIHLGDLTDGMAPKEITRKYVSRIMDDLEECRVPVYMTLGNHDNNYFRNRPNTFSVEEMKEVYRLDREDGRHGMEGATGTERGISYYVDMPERRVRMIFLSSFDDMAPVRYGYTDRQLTWLKEVLYSAGAGTRFLIFSHDAPLAQLDFWSSHIRNGEKLLEILEECNSREDYQVAGFFYGHTHSDYVFEECSFPLISTGCSKLEYMLEKKPEGAVTYPREPDTASQELWDNLLVDLEEEMIRMIRFGAGVDREVSFKKKNHACAAGAALEKDERNRIMKILITGFAPFGGETINPSWEAVSRLPEQFQTSNGTQAVLVRCQMPVSYDRCGGMIEELIEKERPDCVICVGQAGGRMGLEVEQIAINLKDAASADNDHVSYHGIPVTPGGPDGRFARLPVRDMVAACRAAGIPAKVSLSAGAYVCNCLMYHVLELIEQRYPDMRGGFIHVPYECRQAAVQEKAKPSLPLDTIADGLLACLKAL